MGRKPTRRIMQQFKKDALSVLENHLNEVEAIITDNELKKEPNYLVNTS